MIKAYHQPRELDEALGLIAAGATPVAGATALYTARAKRDVELCDVTRLGLDGIAVEPGRVLLGAGVTLTRLAEAREIPGIEGDLLRGTAAVIGSRPLRNAITLGGNVAHACYWADMPVALLALDASLEIARAGKPAEVARFEETCEAGGRPWDGGLITRVIVPRGAAGRGMGFERFVRTANDYAFATVAAVVSRRGDAAADVHLVLGAVQARAFRAHDAEVALEGKPWTEARLAEVCDRLAADVSLAPNFRAPSDYRRKLVAVLSRRALAAAWAAAREA